MSVIGMETGFAIFAITAAVFLAALVLWHWRDLNRRWEYFHESQKALHLELARYQLESDRHWAQWEKSARDHDTLMRMIFERVDRPRDA